MKLLTIIGARPQFIKAATVSRALAATDGIAEVIVHTGQHFDANMSDIFFDDLKIPRPDYNLGISGGTHGAMTGQMLIGIEEVLLKEKPDCVLVYGDTNSTLAGALAAVKLHIPIAHVEAGLRSFNRKMPEEVNRVLTDHASSILFAPTEIAMNNMRAEGLPEDRLRLVGDVMYDAALYFRDRAQEPEWFRNIHAAKLEFALATLHRAENTDDPVRLRGILEELSISNRTFILPLHPRTQARIRKFSLTIPSNVHVVPPVGYLEMVWLEINASIIATDSGGVQKEAYFHWKKCVTLRDETEWVELIEAGVNTLVGANPERISKELSVSDFPCTDVNLYGSGNAAKEIVRQLL